MSLAAIGCAVGAACCSRPNPSSVSTGGSSASPSSATPSLSATIRRSISTKRPDSARFDHSALAVVWTSTIQPWPCFSAVTSGVPSASRAQVLPARSMSGSASTCRDTVTSAGIATPAHRQQMVALFGEMRPGEAQQHPAGLDPFAHGFLFRRRIRAGIRIDQHGELALQQFVGRTAADFGERIERALEVIGLAEQRLGAGAAAGGDADRTAAPALVDEQCAAGRWLALDVDAGDPVAQLARIDIEGEPSAGGT